MDIQLIIVILVGLGVSFVLIRGVYRFFFTNKKSAGICGSCNACEFNPQNLQKSK
ncbi:MAG: FeoB-associated Cys-rich membrane protein [Proteiniphilum sp.]|nr:FeoB-associated Cys-rich membrane protein [Proteiniphilum sp.]